MAGVANERIKASFNCQSEYFATFKFILYLFSCFFVFPF